MGPVRAGGIADAPRRINREERAAEHRLRDGPGSPAQKNRGEVTEECQDRPCVQQNPIRTAASGLMVPGITRPLNYRSARGWELQFQYIPVDDRSVEQSRDKGLLPGSCEISPSDSSILGPLAVCLGGGILKYPLGWKR